jgi:fatty-acyl-CoA synthase
MRDGAVLGPGWASLPAERAAQAPDRLYAVFPDDRVTFGELDARITAMARRLLAAGVQRGDRVGLLLSGGSVDFIALLFAAAKVGGIAVSINARYKAAELRYVAEHAGLRVLIADPRYDAVVDAAGVRERCPVHHPADPAFDSGLERASAADVAAAEAAVEGGDPALMLYTSGTTARPKGALLSHHGLLHQARGFATRLELTADDRFWTPLPLFHIAGITVLMASLYAGARMVHVGFFEPTLALDQLEQERCTVAFPAFETIWMNVLYHPRFEQADLSALRHVTALGTPEKLREMQARLPQAVQVSSTGSTESGGFLCLGAVGDSLESRLTTAGRPLPGMEVKVVNPDTGEQVPPGVDGELLFRGPTRFMRYHDDPEATAAAIDADGFFHSGDIVRATEQGEITYVGRYKDMLKVGGENVAAAEIEDHLATHPAVEVVQVVSAPDARYTEVPAAFVKLRPGAEATEEHLIAHCQGAIATFKIPAYVRFVEEWPLAGEKIQKRVLREWIAAELAEPGPTPDSTTP